jgi:hypothetical protein
LKILKLRIQLHPVLVCPPFLGGDRFGQLLCEGLAFGLYTQFEHRFSGFRGVLAGRLDCRLALLLGFGPLVGELVAEALFEFGDTGGFLGLNLAPDSVILRAGDRLLAPRATFCCLFGTDADPVGVVTGVGLAKGFEGHNYPSSCKPSFPHKRGIFISSRETSW